MQSLGVDSTVFVQFFIFLLFYPVLSCLLFRPYFKLQNQKEHETSERMKQAEKFKAKQQNLQEQYKKLTYKFNKEFNDIYNQESQKIKQTFLNRQSKNQAVLLKEFKEKQQIFFQEIKKAESEIQIDIKELTKTATHCLTS